MRGPVLLIFLTVFLDLLGVGLILPITPYLVRQFQTDALTVGLLVLSFSAAQFVMTPVLGALSDRYGRRPVLLLSLLGTAVGYFLFGAAKTLEMMFAARMLDGITGGNISTAQAYLADVTPPEDRAKSFGLIGAAFGLGFLLGPAMGGVLSGISLQAPAYAAGMLALLTSALAWAFLPESLPPERRKPGALSIEDLNPFRQIILAFQRPALPLLLVAVFLFNFAYSQLQSHFAVYTLVRFGLNEKQNAAYLTYLGFLSVVMQGFLIRRLMPKFGEKRLVWAGMALGMAGFVSTTLAPTAAFLFFSLTLLAAGSGMAVPSMSSLISRRVGPEEQGLVMGVTHSLASLARIAGPLVAGLAFDHIDPTAPYWTAALAVAGALLLLAEGQRTRTGTAS